MNQTFLRLSLSTDAVGPFNVYLNDLNTTPIYQNISRKQLTEGVIIETPISTEVVQYNVFLENLQEDCDNKVVNKKLTIYPPVFEPDTIYAFAIINRICDNASFDIIAPSQYLINGNYLSYYGDCYLISNVGEYNLYDFIITDSEIVSYEEETHCTSLYPCNNPTQTPTNTPTQTNTPSITPSVTLSETPSSTTTPTVTSTPSQTPTSTTTPSVTPTNTPSQTITNTPTQTPSQTPTLTSTSTQTPTLTITQTQTSTLTSTPTQTPSQTPTLTVTPTEGYIPPSPSVTPTSTTTPTETPPSTPDPTQTSTPTQTPDPTQTGTPTQTPDPTQTGTPTQTPDPTQTGTPTQTPDPTQTGTPTQTPDPTQTGTPTQTLDPTPTPTNTSQVQDYAYAFVFAHDDILDAVLNDNTEGRVEDNVRIDIFGISSGDRTYIPTKDPNNSVELNLDVNEFNRVKDSLTNNIRMELPLIDDGGRPTQIVTIKEVDILPDNITYAVGNNKINKNNFYTKNHIKSFYMYDSTDSKIGLFVINGQDAFAQYKQFDESFELVKIPNEENYVVQKISDLKNPGEFLCGFDESAVENIVESIESGSRSATPENGYCIRLGIDVDFATYNNFNGDEEAILIWVSSLCLSAFAIYIETWDGLINWEITLVHIWNTQDPVMVQPTPIRDYWDIRLRDGWNDIQELVDLYLEYDLHVIYFFTILDEYLSASLSPNPTGLLGTAYLDQICKYNVPYVTSNLGISYQLYPYGISTRNTLTLAHELGHLIGFHHTFNQQISRGWGEFQVETDSPNPIEPYPGCYVSGTCTSSCGDIMSYCGNKLPEFHPVLVDFLPYHMEHINQQCVTTDNICLVPPTEGYSNSLSYHMGSNFTIQSHYNKLTIEDLIKYIDWPGFLLGTERGSQIIKIPLNDDGTFDTFNIPGSSLYDGDFTVLILTKNFAETQNITGYQTGTVMGNIEISYDITDNFTSYNTADLFYGHELNYEGNSIDQGSYRALFSPAMVIKNDNPSKTYKIRGGNMIEYTYTRQVSANWFNVCELNNPEDEPITIIWGDRPQFNYSLNNTYLINTADNNTSVGTLTSDPPLYPLIPVSNYCASIYSYSLSDFSKLTLWNINTGLPFIWYADNCGDTSCGETHPDGFPTLSPINS